LSARDLLQSLLRRRRFLVVAAAVPIVLAVLLLRTGLNARSDHAKPEPKPALTVTATMPEQVEWPVTVEASGAVAPWQEAVIGARIGGLPLAAVSADVGDVVRAGQVLARFDDATVRAEVAQAAAALAQAQANQRQAEVNSERARRLQGTGVMSVQEALQYTTLADTTQAQVKLQEAALAAAKLRLDYTRVVAPDDGVIASRSATLGAVSQSGGELFRLIRQQRLEWRAELTATQLQIVRPGMAASLTLPEGTVVTGRVRQVSPALDANTRLGIAYVDLDKAGDARAAMYVNGRITSAMRPALVVPGESVVIRDGRPYIFLLDADRVTRVAVTTGRRDTTRVEILSGLEAGKTLVARGAGFLNDGDTVRVAPAEAPIAKNAP
jgi:RND family efflux transporter MFP subunit